MTNLAGMLLTADRFADALPVARAAHGRAVARFGPEGGYTAVALTNLGEAEEGLGRLGAAYADLGHVVAIFDKDAIAGPNRVEALAHLGQVALMLGKPDAIATLERAIAAGDAGGVDPQLVAPARFALARALQPAAHARAVALATRARDDYGRTP